MAEEYGGVLGAFPYAYRHSESTLFKAYVLAAAVATALLALTCTLAVVVVFGQTAGARGGSFTLSRSFVALLGLLAVLPAVAPVLLVARGRRHATADADEDGDARGPFVSRYYEPLLAVGGFLFLASLYGGLVASMPETFVLDGETVTRPPATGPVVAALYALPAATAPLLPAVPAALIALVHWRLR